jgi:DnaK suppressor protein
LTAVKKASASAKKAAPAKKAPVAKKTPAAKKTAPAKKSATPAKKATPAKAAAAKSPIKKATVTTPIPAKKSPASTKAAPAKKSTAAKAPPAKKSAATKTAAKKAPAAVKAAPAASVAPAPVKAVKKAAPEPPKRPTVGPYAKDTKFLDAQRVLLNEERTIYAGQAVDLRAEADSLALEREPGDVQFDEESGEGGTVTVDRERNLALSGQAMLAVEEIDDALRRIEDNTFGYCERCFQPIPKPRLRALPYARLCVACKSGGLSRR